MSGLSDPSEAIFFQSHPDQGRSISYSGLLAMTGLVTVCCLEYSMFYPLGVVAYSYWASRPCCFSCGSLPIFGRFPCPSELSLAKIGPKRRL